MESRACTLCPRQCGADRSVSVGYCLSPDVPRIARAALHLGEEPCISGTRGAGTVFFTGCNLRCVFCQNYLLRDGRHGKEVSPSELADLYLMLEDMGAHNIDLVTPSPHVEAVISSIELARKRGLRIPFVYNTNAYETPETLRRLEGLIEVYLPDFKYLTPALSKAFSGAEDYPLHVLPAILEMYRQTGALVTGEDGIASRGLLIRHLVLPACVDETRRILDCIKENLSLGTALSLMRQYTPTEACTKAPLNRRLTDREYDRAVDYCLSLGFSNVYIQEKGCEALRYTPVFDLL